MARVAGSTPATAPRPPQTARRAGAGRSAEELIDATTSTSSTSAPRTHRTPPLAEQALAAGKPIVCEKPLATDAGRRASGSPLAAGDRTW